MRVSGPILTAFVVAIALPGCTALRLQQSVTSQATTLADLHYQQVLNNLALFSAVPDALPSHVQIHDGSAQLQDFGQASVSPEIGHDVKTTLGLAGSRTVVEQWGISPVTDDVEVRIIRIAYRRAIGLPDLMDRDLANDLAEQICKQTAETSDVDRRELNSTSEHMREEFARRLGDRASALLARETDPQKRADAYQDIINETAILDTYYNLKFIGANSGSIILDDEYDSDPTLEKFRPDIYSPILYHKPVVPLKETKDQERERLRNLANQIRVATALARTARQDVKDTQADLRKIGPGWFETGYHGDVPKGACYVGRCGDHYAWVSPSGMKGLADFTVNILKFSSLVKENSVLTVTGGPRFTPSGGR